jgi:hypothetical protein
VLIAVLIVLAIAFGGFQKGAKVSGESRVPVTVHVGAIAPFVR